MPGIIAHRLFADDVFLSLSDDGIKQAILQAADLYSIGSQGPDLFFFYHPWPWCSRKRTKIINRIGSKLHAQGADALLVGMAQIAMASKDPRHLSYLAGMIDHWALDGSVHPYVYAHCGKGTEQSGIRHREMESLLDRRMLERNERTTSSFRPAYVVRYHSTTYQYMYDLYAPVVEASLGITLKPAHIRDALRDFYRVECLLYDPRGYKKSGMRQLERMAHREGVLSSLIMPTASHANADVFNDSHSAWVHPCTGETHTESIDELYEEAKKRALAVLAVLEDMRKGKADEQALLEAVQNRSFSTGLSDDMPMRYFTDRAF